MTKFIFLSILTNGVDLNSLKFTAIIIRLNTGIFSKDTYIV